MEDNGYATMRRMWINQPSSLQPLHRLHAVRVLAASDTEACARVYFLGGETVSMQVPHQALSGGWPPCSKASPTGERVGAFRPEDAPMNGGAADHINNLFLTPRAVWAVMEAMTVKGIPYAEMTLDALDTVTDDELRLPRACGSGTIADIRAEADRYLERRD